MYNKLKKIREEKGLTQEDMALKLGLKSKNAYSMKERGERKISLNEAKVISLILGNTIDEIFFGKNVNVTVTKRIKTG